MSDNHDYLRSGEDSSFRLRADVTMLMLRGGSYAAIFCLVMLILVWGLYGIGLLLPEESRDTPDPTPFSQVIDPAAEQVQKV